MIETKIEALELINKITDYAEWSETQCDLVVSIEDIKRIILSEADDEL